MLSDGILACRAQKELEAERQARLDSEASAAALKEQLQKARADAEDNQRDALQQIQVLQQQIQNIQAIHTTYISSSSPLSLLPSFSCSLQAS